MNVAGDIVNPPTCRNSVDRLTLTETKVNQLMDRLNGIIVWEKKKEMEEEHFVPQGLGYKADTLLEVFYIHAMHLIYKSEFCKVSSDQTSR